jgi:hypothetical protein
VPLGPKSAIGPALVGPVMAAPSAMVMVVSAARALGGIWIWVPARVGSSAAVTVSVAPAEAVTSLLTTYLLPTVVLVGLQATAQQQAANPAPMNPVNLIARRMVCLREPLCR